MAAKGAKEALVNKLGFKSSSSRSVEQEMEKLRRENQHLKKSLEETRRGARHQHSHPDSERTKLLERILALETLREKNSQQLLNQDQEISILRQQLRSAHGDVVSALQSQLELKEQQFQVLSKETEELKNRFCVVSERCDSLEKLKVSSGELTAVQEQLRDALEKNQHWLVYDQQREAFVQGILTRVKELEAQLNEANQALQQQKEAITEEVEDLRSRLEEKTKEATQAREQLLEERRREREALLEERRREREALMEERSCSSERMALMQAEMEDQRNRAAQLLSQVNLLQKSLLNQKEEQKRVAFLEQQIQMSAKESENDKLDRQTLQHQLHKVLKELRKAREQITRLESSKLQKESRFSEPGPYNRIDLERLTIQDQMTSPSKANNILDESILECPNCGASYPTSHHRELLAHLDDCFS
ncbi:hypothetical protein DNTS_001138 [Danionella cerebrum]|uniref:Centrosomal protein of 55 kDa n=1 Tax=Danionella cerebrum TaxID=2873325 RepID=A0A553QBG7_9TELE|nr:hypothetical protein DNTS_001138 [Danionella translucida]TRY87270.1 hypothetical protein DNTS_001138 [Danionella translucida]